MSDELPRFFTIKPSLFSGRFFFYFGPWDRPEAIRDWYLAHGLKDQHDRLKDWKEDGYDDAEMYGGKVCNPYPANPVLMMQVIPHTPHEIGNLVHEIHHMVQRWTYDIGIYTDRNSEEVFAYVEGNLVEMVLDYLWHGIVGAGLEPDDDPKFKIPGPIPIP